MVKYFSYIYFKKIKIGMLIQEVVQRTGLSRDTIRYYEKIGLIRTSRKQRRDNNYKEYNEEIIERLLIVKRAKNLGFSLKEIKDLIDLWAGKTLSKEERIALFNSRIAIIEDKIRRLNEVRHLILERIEQVKNE